MIIAESKYGSVIAGQVIKIKYGSGKAADKLTIVTLKDVSYAAQAYGKSIKLLFWNSERTGNLSNRARKFKIGDVITARVVFDIGNPNKAVCYEMKKSGIYTLTEISGEKSFVACGKAQKILIRNNYFGACIPIDRYENRHKITEWVLISFWGTSADSAAKSVQKGDIIIARGNMMKKVSYQNKSWKEVTGIRFRAIEQYALASTVV